MGDVMRKIIEFDNMDEFINYRKNIAFFKIGSGSEGTCYLGKDKFVYKDLTDGCFPYNLDASDIITCDDINTESFIFPDVLFVENNKLIGYRSKFIKNNLFNDNLLFKYGVDHIDFDKLIDAYYIMCNDAEKLAADNIRIFDLSYNILFDGEKLYGIDTDHYKIVDYPVREHNISCVDSAIKNEFIALAEYVFEENIHGVFSKTKVVDFLKLFENKYKNNSNVVLSTSGYQYTKK